MKLTKYFVAITVVLMTLPCTQAFAERYPVKLECPPVPYCAQGQQLYCPPGMQHPRCGCVDWVCIRDKVPLNLDLKLPSQEPRSIEELTVPAPPKLEAPPITPSMLEPVKPDLPGLIPPTDGAGEQ